MRSGWSCEMRQGERVEGKIAGAGEDFKAAYFAGDGDCLLVILVSMLQEVFDG